MLRQPLLFITPLLRTGVQAVALAIAALPGCTPAAPDRLVVATSWPRAERRRLETEFQSWVAASHDHLGHRLVRLQWLVLAPGDDPLKLARRPSPPQVFLGGGPTLALLGRTDELLPIEHAGSARWCTVTRRATATTPFRPALTPPQAWSDPRGDRASLVWAMKQFSEAGWREGYARLIRTAADGERLGRSSASALETPSVEVVAIAKTASEPDLAQGFLRFLCQTQGATAADSPGEAGMGASALVNSLVADLLGSTLVDAQDELWTAWRAVAALPDREKALGWLLEPPPWPPASVAKYLGREGERAMALIETLSAEVAPEPPARAWLKRSWLSPARLLDQTLLSELAQAAEGRLCREPRFRAWLREEWTAWARQRYRRVARWAGSQASRPGGERVRALP